jgi:hypothetical protein
MQPPKCAELQVFPHPSPRRGTLPPTASLWFGRVKRWPLATPASGNDRHNVFSLQGVAYDLCCNAKLR